MIGHLLSDFLGVYGSYARAVTRLAWQNQWQLLDVQYRAGVRLLNTLAGGSIAQETRSPRASPVPAMPGLTKSQNLEQHAVQRLRQGLAPPREIYQIPHRGRVDWSTLPEWARPCDPELFEGCSHEG